MSGTEKVIVPIQLCSVCELSRTNDDSAKQTFLYIISIYFMNLLSLLDGPEVQMILTSSLWLWGTSTSLLDVSRKLSRHAYINQEIRHVAAVGLEKFLAGKDVPRMQCQHHLQQCTGSNFHCAAQDDFFLVISP